jgi:CubicO group peptidase (beta-lactamase class C family)
MGFSSARLDSIDSFYADKVNRQELAGIVILVARHGKIVHLNAIGYADVVTRKKMQTDTLFRIYSMTKPIAATALMMLYEKGLFQLDDPVSNYIPEFSKLRVLRTPDSSSNDTVPMQREPTIHDLFRHTAGFEHGGEEYRKANVFGLDISLEEMMKKLAILPLRFQPGTQFQYSVGPDVQARLVEIFSGIPFDQFLQKRLLGPLGMEDTSFWAKGDKASRLARVHWCKDGKLVPSDDANGYPGSAMLISASNINSYSSDNRHKGGSYGLLSTAADYWRFAQMMLDGGQFEGARFLSPNTVNYMVRDHLGTIPGMMDGTGWGLGFAILKDATLAGRVGSEGTFFWGGFGGTVFWVDPKNDLVVVAMTQHMLVPAADEFVLHSQLSSMVYAALIH